MQIPLIYMQATILLMNNKFKNNLPINKDFVSSLEN